MSDPIPGATRYAGSRVQRVEDPRLLAGRGTFVDDVVRPGTLHACFVRSTLARARVLGIDTSEAVALRGVHAAFVAADLNPGVHDVWFTGDGEQSPRAPLPPLAHEEMRFVGDPVALVVAESRYIAEDAAELVVVDYEPLAPVVDYVGAPEQDELVHAGFARNIAGELQGGSAEQVDEVLASALHTVEHTIFQRAYAAAPIETRGMVVEWDPATGELTIGAGSGMARAATGVFVREGARVLAADISGREDETAAALGDAVVPFHVDVVDEVQVEAMFAAALEAFGRVDAVLNVAGIAGAQPVVDVTLDDYERIMAVDLRGVMLVPSTASRRWFPPAAA